MNQVKGTAISLTEGLFYKPHAKTTHGILRGTSRFQLKGVIDSSIKEDDAGVALDGKHRAVPVFSSIEEFLSSGQKVDYCIIGVATAGGILPPELKSIVKTALNNNISVINGLHSYLNESEEFIELLKDSSAKIIDIRKPKHTKDLTFWSGKIFDVKTPKIGVIGVDCAIGKRTTSKMIVHALKDKNKKAEMIYTGQTGWMEGWDHGFILDSTVNDFVSGEMEKAVVDCANQKNPDFIVIEGQSALRNYSGPCGAEILLSANVDGVILVFAPGREFMKGWGHLNIKTPQLENEIELIRMYGKEVIGVSVNTKGITEEEGRTFINEYSNKLSIPMVMPMFESIDLRHFSFAGCNLKSVKNNGMFDEQSEEFALV